MPITLAITFVIGGFEPSLNRILSATVYMICPEKVFDFLKTQEQNKNGTEEINKESIRAENTESVITSANINSVIPDDIQKLVEEAEKKYANSSNDGKIISAVNRASGVIPQIAYVAGKCIGTASAIASMFDIIVKHQYILHHISIPPEE